MVELALSQTAERQGLVGETIRHPIPHEAIVLQETLRTLSRDFAQLLPDDAPFKWGYGDHKFAAVPWVGQRRHFEPGDPVVAMLFAADGSSAYLALHMKSAKSGEGIAAFTPEEMSAWAEFHREEVGVPPGFIAHIELATDKGLSTAYAASTICAMEYPASDTSAADEVAVHWATLLAMRERVLESRPDDDAVRDWAIEREAAKLRGLSLAELRKRADDTGRKRPKRLPAHGTTYRRSAAVVALAKARAMGECDLCRAPAPFQDKYGFPFLEAHHIVWLSRGGPDRASNAVALCPNCHRKMHLLSLADDQALLQQRATAYGTAGI